MVEALNAPSASLNGVSSSEQFHHLCDDLLQKAKEYKEAFQFHIKPTSGAVEYWKNYRERLRTYDRQFKYPNGVNPVKCALKGWKYLSDGKLQCAKCKNELEIIIPGKDTLTDDQIEQAAVEILKSLRYNHDSLCEFQAAFHYSILLHSVRELQTAIKNHIPEQLFKSIEISNEFANLGHIAVIEPSFSLYFAIAGWFVTKDKKFFCKLCLQTVNPAEYENQIMDPLKLHYDYCPLLEAYPQWRLALEEYVYANSNPQSINENFAIIQRQLAMTGLETKPIVYEFTPSIDLDEDIPSVHDKTEVGTSVANRTMESMQEPANQDVLEQPKLRDTDFEMEIRQESLNRKRQRTENEEQESPAAKRSNLLFPFNYLAAYNQPIKEAEPASMPALHQTLDNDQSHVNNPETSTKESRLLIVSEDFSKTQDEKMDLNVENNGEYDEDMKTDMRTIDNEEESVQLPLHNEGQVYSSEDEKSDEAESCGDDEAATDSEPADEQTPYNEPTEFHYNSEYQFSENKLESEESLKDKETVPKLNDANSEDDGAVSSSSFEGEEEDLSEGDDFEEPESEEDKAKPKEEATNVETASKKLSRDDSDSDIIVLD